MTTIAKIKTVDNGILRIDKHKVSGVIFIDCRVWRDGVPSQQGFSIDPTQIPEVIEALREAMDFKGRI